MISAVTLVGLRNDRRSYFNKLILGKLAGAHRLVRVVMELRQHIFPKLLKMQLDVGIEPTL